MHKHYPIFPLTSKAGNDLSSFVFDHHKELHEYLLSLRILNNITLTVPFSSSNIRINEVVEIIEFPPNIIDRYNKSVEFRERRLVSLVKAWIFINKDRIKLNILHKQL